MFRFPVSEQIVDPKKKAVECGGPANDSAGGIVNTTGRFVKWAHGYAVGAVQPVFNPELVAFFRVDVPFLYT